ncbi:hypothetical protein Rs2_15958 [Raphanus sativus]|nr:hypothetical protein Rs2_15958 [Raphanus sativus]
MGNSLASVKTASQDSAKLLVIMSNLFPGKWDLAHCSKPISNRYFAQLASMSFNFVECFVEVLKPVRPRCFRNQVCQMTTLEIRYDVSLQVDDAYTVLSALINL